MLQNRRKMTKGQNKWPKLPKTTGVYTCFTNQLSNTYPRLRGPNVNSISWHKWSRQWNINHWLHIKATEWFSSTRWGVMAANNCLSLGSDWLDVSDSLTRSGQKSDFIHHRWSTSRSWFHSKTSLIGCISRPWNGSAAPDEVLWLQTTASVWAQIGCRFRNF
jgi:hypothetical protein